MKRLYTFLFILLCTITASAKIEYYLLSDSIFEPTDYHKTEYTKPNGEKVSMSAYERFMADEDGLILLTGEWQYIQITDKPFYVLKYNTETDECNFLYAYDTYYDLKYDASTDTYSREYWYGTYNPRGSRLAQIMHGNCSLRDYSCWELWGSHKTQPWEALWFTEENYNDEIYYCFNMSQGLYAICAVFTDDNSDIVLQTYRIDDLLMPECRYPFLRIYQGQTETSSNISVNTWYTYYTITGGNITNTYLKMTEKYTRMMEGKNIIPNGEYAGCQYECFSTWPSNYYVSFTYPHYSTSYNSGYGYKIEGVESKSKIETDKWYELQILNSTGGGYGTCYYGVNAPSGSKLWLIWDIDGKRVKVVHDADFQKILSDATAIDNPIEVPYSPNYYSLDGQVVENPTPGKIYIHNGKKVVYKK